MIDTPSVVHNSWLEIAAETGIVGICLMATIVLFSLVPRFGRRASSGGVGERKDAGRRSLRGHGI